MRSDTVKYVQMFITTCILLFHILSGLRCCILALLQSVVWSEDRKSFHLL